MSKLDKDQVIAKFTEAYTAANGKAPTIETKGGWYSVDGGKNIRLAQLDEMTAEFAGSKPAKKAAPKKEVAVKEEAPKKAAAPKKTAAKKPAARTKTAKKSDFTVKDFWAKQIGDSNRRPR